jgi:hypothetical protein
MLDSKVFEAEVKFFTKDFPRCRNSHYRERELEGTPFTCSHYEEKDMVRIIHVKASQKRGARLTTP